MELTGSGGPAADDQGPHGRRGREWARGAAVMEQMGTGVRELRDTAKAVTSRSQVEARSRGLGRGQPANTLMLDFRPLGFILCKRTFLP